MEPLARMASLAPRAAVQWLLVVALLATTHCNDPIPAELAGTWHFRPPGDYEQIAFRVDGSGAGYYSADRPRECVVLPCPPELEKGTFRWRRGTLHLSRVSPSSGPERSYDARFTPGGLELRHKGKLVSLLTRQSPVAPLPPPSTPSHVQEAADGVPQPAPGTPCSGLTRRQCTQTPACVLDVVSPRTPGQPEYACHVPANPCEGLAAQSHGSFRTTCEGRPGCRWVRGMGYCPCRGYGRTVVADPEEQPCACGGMGGPVDRCVPSGEGPGSAVP